MTYFLPILIIFFKSGQFLIVISYSIISFKKSIITWFNKCVALLKLYPIV